MIVQISRLLQTLVKLKWESQWLVNRVKAGPLNSYVTTYQRSFPWGFGKREIIRMNFNNAFYIFHQVNTSFEKLKRSRHSCEQLKFCENNEAERALKKSFSDFEKAPSLHFYTRLN